MVNDNVAFSFVAVSFYNLMWFWSTFGSRNFVLCLDRMLFCRDDIFYDLNRVIRVSHRVCPISPFELLFDVVSRDVVSNTLRRVG